MTSTVTAPARDDFDIDARVHEVVPAAAEYFPTTTICSQHGCNTGITCRHC